MAVDAATTGRGNEAAGGVPDGWAARGARRQRRWAEVVGRRWRRARHSMTCHVPTLPLTHSPPRAPRRVSTSPPPSPTPALQLPRPSSPHSHPPPRPLLQGCVCVYGKYSRVRPLISRRARYTYPAASSYEAFVPACWKVDVGPGDRARLCARGRINP